MTFYQAVMRPDWGLLESGFCDGVWENARPAFSVQVLGPHFEEMCREFVATTPGLFHDLPGQVGQGTVYDRATHEQIQVDVAVLGPQRSGQRRRVLALGEVKWGKRLGQRHLDRLRRARDILAAQGYDTGDTILTLYSGEGFEDDLAGVGDHVMTVGLEQLYGDPAASPG